MMQTTKKEVYVVAHTHWDREWYFSTSESMVLIDNVFKDIIKTLNKNKHYTFTLDGQVSIIEDFLNYNPDYLKKIKKLVDLKQLDIGPWYTQTDTLYLNSESIISNLYYGIYYSKKNFNDYMIVLYLPDSFGFSNSIPMIAQGFNINNVIIWRGISYAKHNLEPIFRWQYQNNQVKVVSLNKGYGAFKKADGSKEFINQVLAPQINEYENATKQDIILMPVGNDQHNIDPQLIKTITKYGVNYKLQRYEQYFNAINLSKTVTYQGELLASNHTRIHKSSGAIRNDLKQLNFQLEQQIKSNQSLFNRALHYQLVEPSLLIWNTYKKLFENQAHDALIGCVSDKVAFDIKARGKQAMELLKAQENLLKYQFANYFKLKANQIIIFNWNYYSFQEYQIVKVIAPYQKIKLKDISTITIDTKYIMGKKNALVETKLANYFEKEEDYYIHTIIIKDNFKPQSYHIYEIIKQEQTEQPTTKQYISNKQYHFVVVNNQLILTYKDQVIKDF
ncbi:MAG: hypothetical protein ACRCTA_06930, partial [Bacilli bacterium]